HHPSTNSLFGLEKELRTKPRTQNPGLRTDDCSLAFSPPRTPAQISLRSAHTRPRNPPLAVALRSTAALEEGSNSVSTALPGPSSPRDTPTERNVCITWSPVHPERPERTQRLPGKLPA